MNLDLSREALTLLQELLQAPTGELARTVHGRVIKFETNGHTLNDPASSKSTADWEDATFQLLANEFIEEISKGIFKLTTAGTEYANTHLK